MAESIDFNSGYGLFVKRVGLSFLRAFVGALIVLIPGVLAAPNFEAGKALLVAALIGAVTAGVRAVQAFLALGDLPAEDSGTEVLSEEPK